MFLGEYQHSIDAKGRIAVPARFRAQLERGAVITQSIEDQCLQVFPLETFERKAQELAAMNQDARAHNFRVRRLFTSGAPCELDAQGRIILPLKLRKYAELQSEALVLGVNERFEIWHPAHWEAYLVAMRDEDLAAPQVPF